MSAIAPSRGEGVASATPDTLSGTKRCTKCGHVKGLASFHRMASSSDGRRPDCKQCRKPGSRAYYEANAEQERERAREWREANPDRNERYQAEWRANNREKRRALSRAYYAKNRDRILAYHRSPERRAANRANAKDQKAKRRAAIAATVNPISASQWRSVKESYSGLCVYCHRPLKRATQDHVVPLSRGGDHSVTNVVPACRKCNRAKSDLPLIVFLTRRAANQ